MPYATYRFNKIIAAETIRFIVTVAIVVYKGLKLVVYRMLTEEWMALQCVLYRMLTQMMGFSYMLTAVSSIDLFWLTMIFSCSFPRETFKVGL